MKNNETTICVVGLGYVGLPLAILAQRKGYFVTGVDVDKKRVGLINQGEVPFVDDTLSTQIKKHPISATTDFEVCSNASTIIVCVPTPVKGHKMPDLGPVKNAVSALGKYLAKGTLVIIESTINPGVCNEVIIPLMEKVSKLKCGKDFYLSHCPERINPGDDRWNVSNIPRVVGSFERVGLRKTIRFYRSILDAPLKAMGSLKEAEAVKIVENTFRDVNIAFVNELAQSFATLGIDVVNVIDGAATKPFAFMPHYPGCGVGGHCIPVDPYYLIEYAKDNGYDHKFLSLARQINHSMPEYTVSLLLEALKAKGIRPNTIKVALLGLAYKPNVSDMRESPASEMLSFINKQNIKVNVYDPYLPKLSTHKNVLATIQEVDGVLIATAHKEFLKLNPQNLTSTRVKVVVDGRNCLDKTKFSGTKVQYIGVGR